MNKAELIADQLANGLNVVSIWGNIYFNVKESPYLAKGDGASNDTSKISAAVTAAAVRGGIVLFPPGTYVTNSFTVPSNVTLLFSNGAKLSINTGQTVTINGPIDAGIYQIFSGLGAVSGGMKVDRVYVQWFGAKGVGVSDDSAAIQKTFDYCSLNGQKIHFPIGVYLVNTPIVLYDCFNLTQKRAYKISGENTELSSFSNLSDKCRIVPSCNLFESGTVGGIAQVSLSMTDMFVQYGYSVSIAYTMFNNITLRGAYFARNRIESAHTWLKGNLTEISTVENNVFYHVKKYFIKESDYSNATTNYSCSDSIIRNNYINGDGTQNCIMINTYFYDFDMRFEENFVDYFAYLFQGLDAGKTYLGIFNQNIVNHCFRVLNGHVSYGVFTRNTLEYCRYVDCVSIFTNPLPEMTASTRWGGFIFDETSPYNIYKLVLYDNILMDSDTILYFVSVNAFRKYVQGFLYEKGSVNGNITFQQMNDNTAFSTTKVQSLDYAIEPTFTDVKQVVSGNTVLNAYEGQHKWMAGVLYIAHLVNSVPVWVETKGGLSGNKGINVTVAGSATSLVVTFAKAEVDNSYGVQVLLAWNTTSWITSKSTTGFTINFGTAPSGASTLDWSISR